MNAEVLVKFNGDTKDLDKETSKAQSSLKGFASGVSSAFKVATGVIASTTAVVTGLIAASVKAYGEFEQLQGGAQKIFDEMDYSKIEKDANEAYKTMNLSASQYLDMINSVGATFAATMGDEKGYDTAKKGMQTLADYASGTGKDINLLNDKYKAISRSTTSYLSIADQFSGILPQTTKGFLEQAQASGYLSDKYTELSQVPVQEYQEALTNMLEDGVGKMGLLGNTVAESEKTITGSFNAMKSSWSNFIVALSSGEDMTDVIDKLIDSAATFAKNIMPVIMRAIESIGNALPKIADYIGKELPGLVDKLLPPLIEVTNTLINSLITALPGLLNTLIPLLTQTLISLISMLAQNLPAIIQALLSGIITIIQSLAQALPTLIPQLITAILDGILTILDNIDMLIDCGIQLLFGLIDGIIQALPILIDKLPMIIDKIVTALVNNLPKLLEAGVRLTIELAKGLIKAIPQLISKLPQIGMSIVNGIGKFVGNMGNVGRNLIKGLWNGISNVTGWIIGKIRGFGSSVLKAIKGIFGVHSPSTEFEWIGKMNMVGLEQGMEDLQPQLQRTINGMFDLQPNVSGSMQSTYSPQMNIQVVNNLETDPLGQLVNNIKTFSGGAKNDYNWGSSL